MSVMSGVITVAVAGTEVAGPATEPGDYLIHPDADNAGAYVYIGNDGTNHVGTASGYKLAKGEAAAISVKSLADVYFDVTNNGDKITWFRMYTQGQ